MDLPDGLRTIQLGQQRPEGEYGGADDDDGEAKWGERKPGNHDLAEVRERIRRYVEEFARDGTRITGNRDFA